MHEQELTRILGEYELLMMKIVEMGRRYPLLHDQFVEIHKDVLEREYVERR